LSKKTNKLESLAENTSTIIALVGSLLIFILSAVLNSKSKFGLALLFLVVGGLILRILISSDLYLHPHDEKFHALVAKNMVEHPFTPTLYDNPIHDVDYRDWAANHIWLHKQPVPLWAMAASISVLGSTEFAVRLPSILLSTLGIWLLYQICLFFFTDKNQRKIAWLAAFLLSINGLILELTGGRVATDHYDIFFMVLILGAIYFTTKFIQTKYHFFNILAGIFIGLAVLTKWLPAFIVLPIWILLVYDSGKFSTKNIIFNSLILASISVLVFLPWQIYIHQAFPSEATYTASFNLRHITEVLDKQTGPFYFFIVRMGTNYGELVYLPLVFLVVYLFRNHKNLRMLSLAIWIFVPLIFFSISQTKMQAYILFIAPALFIISAWFWYYLRDRKFTGFSKYVFYLLLFLMIVLPVRYSLERIKPFAEKDRNPVWSQNLREFSQNEIPEKSLLFNYSRPIEAMYYTNLTAYSFLPDETMISESLSDGYTVYINMNENVSENLKANTRLIFIKIE
jgi:4-amino-4-deoxy-L-arabinose transferase